MKNKLSGTLQDHLGECDPELARRAGMLWKLAGPIHARQTRVDANEDGEAHCRCVEQYLWDLIRRSGTVDEYFPIELFLLSCSACCHDFDKGLGTVFYESHPHGEGSGAFVYEHAGQLVLNRHEADIIDRIIRLHDRTGDDFAAGLSELPFDHPLGSVSLDLQRLAVVLKVGDVLHTDGSRVSDLAVDVSRLSGLARSKLLARRCISGWSVDGRRVIIAACPDTTEEMEAVGGCLGYLKEHEWRPLARSLHAHGLPYELEVRIDDHRLTRQKGRAKSRGLPGMDYYHEEDADLLGGRDADVRALLDLVLPFNLVSLVGPSGVGKSSLLRAGLRPRLLSLDRWQCIITRPDMSTGLFYTPAHFIDSLGRAPEKPRDLANMLAKRTNGGKKLLIAFDQFEDVAYYDDFNADSLAVQMLELQAGKAGPHLLLSYRDDAASLMGAFENRLAHSARGFPHHFLQRLDIQDARESIRNLLNAKGLALQPSARFMELLLTELVAATNAESQSPGQMVYPPYIQMVVERLALLAEGDRVSLQAYQELASDAGASTERVIADYLTDSVARLGERRHDVAGARRVLIVLSRASGKKGAVNEPRISAEAGVSTPRLTLLLKEMVSLRLVRRLATGQWEIAHDLLARRISEDLLDDVERRFKHAREAFESKARMLHELKSLLTSEELRILWLSRERVPPESLNNEERLLILLSMFAFDSRLAAIGGMRTTWWETMAPATQTVTGWWWLQGLSRNALQQLTLQAMGMDIPEGGIALVRLAELLGGRGWLPALIEAMKKEWKEFDWILEEAEEIFYKLATLDSLPLIRNMLKGSGWRVLTTVIHSLEKLVSRDDLPLLRKMLKDSDSGIRLTATIALGRLASRDDVPSLRDVLKDTNWEVRSEAVNALGELASRDELPLLLNMLKDRNLNVRQAAVEALGKLVSRDELPLLGNMLEDTGIYVRTAAAVALGKLASRDSLPLLRNVLKDRSWGVRRAAVEAFGKLGSRDDLPLLRNILEDRNGNVRKAAVEAFGKLGSRDDLPLLRNILKDRNGNVRKAAVEAFGKLGSRDDLPLMRYLLEDSDSDIQKAATEAFGKLVSRDDLPLLRNMLKDRNWYVRKVASETFGKLGSRDDLSLLWNMLGDSDRSVGIEVSEVFEKLASRDDMPLLRGMLKDRNWWVRKAAAKALGKLASRDDLPQLWNMLDDSVSNVRKATVEALGKLASRDDLLQLRNMLKDSDSYVREAAAEAFAKLGTRDDLPLLRNMLKDSSKDVRKAAVKAFDKFGELEHIELLSSLRIDRNIFLQRLAGKAIFTILTRAIELKGVREEDIAVYLQNHGEDLPTPVLGIFDWCLYAPPYIQKEYEESEKD